MTKSRLIYVLAIIEILVIGLNVKAMAQDSTTVDQKKPTVYWLFDNNYRLATRYNDFAEARSSLYSLITIEPQNDSLLYNLAYLYYDNQVYPSAILVCMDLLKLKPNHLGALEMSAVCYENLGIKDKALANYEKLYMATDDVKTLYKMANLQYDLKKYEESAVNVDILMSKNDLDKDSLVFQMDDKKQKEFSLKIATLNLKGLVLAAQGKNDEAMKAYNDALALAPDFVFAKKNLEKLTN